MVDEVRPGTREAQKRHTRAAVLDAARHEFERVGFEAANVRVIAAAAKVSAGTVLHHFGDKRDLLHAALFDDLQVTLELALKQPGRGTLERRTSALASAVFAYYQRRPTLSRTLLKEGLFAEPPWAERFTAQVAVVHQHLATWTRDAITTGELTADADPALVAAAWLSFFYFALIGWVQGAAPTPVAMVEHLFAQHLAGLRRRAPSPRRRR